MKPIILAPMLYGKYCDVIMPNGKHYCRVVRYSKIGGLYVVIANKRYYESEMEIDCAVITNNKIDN